MSLLFSLSPAGSVLHSILDIGWGGSCGKGHLLRAGEEIHVGLVDQLRSWGIKDCQGGLGSKWKCTLMSPEILSSFPHHSPLQVTVPPDPMLLDHLAQHGVAIDAGRADEDDRLHHAFAIQVRDDEAVAVAVAARPEILLRKVTLD